MSKTVVGVGVSGLGFVGAKAHVSAFRKIPGSKLVAVNDVIEEKAKKISEKYGLKYYLDHEVMLNDPEVEAVVIAVPTPYHYKLAFDAIAKGKHVLCEMPLTPTIAESEELGKLAKEEGVIFMPNLNFRFTPNYVQAKELADEIAEKPVAVHFREFISTPDLAKQWPAESWAWDLKKSGGYPDFTLSVWAIDLLRWLLNSEIEDVQWKPHYYPLEDPKGYTGYNTMGIVRFSTGTVGFLHFGCTSVSSEATSKLELFYANKILRADWNNSLTLIENINQKEKSTKWIFKEKGTKVWGHYQLDEHFIQCILQGKKPKATVEDAIKTQTIAKQMVKGKEEV